MTPTSSGILVARSASARFRQVFGPRLRRVVLYGSQARGDATETSDIDMLLVLDSVTDFWADLRRIDPVCAELSLATDTVISALPIAEEDFDASELPALRTARTEGLVLP